MSELNIYASRIFGEHPLAIWPLDNFDSGTSTQYSSIHYPALIGTETENNMDVGVPLCYGSSGSLRLYPEGGKDIGVTQGRIWKHVNYDPDKGDKKFWVDWETFYYNQLLVEEEMRVPINNPSIEYEGYGMFSEEGKYNSYTAEMWIRIDARSNSAQKIWGNVDGFDGLWIMDNYIILHVGDQWKSYAIENWYRPMLVAVTYTPERARLVINGQEVISLKIDPKLTDFRNKVIVRMQQQNLGFMCPDDALIYEVDNFSIFPYVVPDLALKRRFVWGQGVENIADVANSYQTNTIYFDYPFAEYANNVIFPDLWTWETGYLDGFVSTGKTIRTPAYELPEIYIANRDLDALYLENQFNNSIPKNEVPWFTFKPEYDWDLPSYLRFNNIEKLTEKVQSIVGVFETFDNEKYPLMVFKKTWSNDEVRISVEGDELIYEQNGLEIARETQKGRFVVGFDLNRIVNGTAFPTLRNFFSTVSDVELFVGGDGVTTFNGNIFRVGISDTSNMSRQGFASAFYDNGIVKPELQYLFIEKYCTYTLRPFMAYGKFWLDVSANAYWEATIPLEVLAKNIQKNDAGWVYERTLDSFQINFGYDGEYTINDQGYYDFLNAELRTYISFQPTVGDDTTEILFRDLQPQQLHKNRIVDASTDFEGKAYEIINGTVVIPPAPEGYQVVIYFISNAKSVIRSPMYVKSLSFASLASLDERNTINTLYGIPVSSASRFAITKENLPYLYLTKDSGIEPLDGPVHIDVSSTNSEYNMGLLSMFVKPNYANMTGDVLFEIRYNGGTLSFQKVSGTEDEFDLVFDAASPKTKHTQMFKNGNPIYTYDADGIVVLGNTMKLSDNQWAFIGFEFPEILGMGEVDAGIDLNPGAVYQNIMSSKIGGTQIQQNIITRKWEEVADGDTKDWNYWAGAVSDYLELLTEGKYLEFPVDPSDLYNIFTGHNSLVFDDKKQANIKSLTSRAFADVEWETYNRKPA